MPVMWHQTLLTFVQTYRYNLSEDNKERLKALLKVQQHHSITNEIRREMFGMQKGAAAVIDHSMLMEDE